MRLLFTILLTAFIFQHLNACPVVSSVQYYYFTDSKTKQPLRNVSLTIFYEKKIIRTYVSDTFGVIRSAIYGDSKYDLIIKHDNYSKFETSINLSREYDMKFFITLSHKGKHKISSNATKRGYQNRSISFSNNQLAAQIGHDPEFNKFECKLKHADRAYETYLNDYDKLFNEIFAYPNPINSGELLNIESKYGEQKTLIIYNLSGQVLAQSQIIFHQSLSTAGMPPGLYVLKVIDEKNDDVTFFKLLIR